MILTFTVDCPPSANKIWRNVSNRAIKSKEYRTWLTINSAEIAWQHKYEMIRTACEVHIKYTPPNRRMKDIDNIIKPCLDLLEKADVIENDSLVEIIHARRMPPVKDRNEVELTVIQLASDRPAASHTPETPFPQCTDKSRHSDQQQGQPLPLLDLPLARVLLRAAFRGAA